MTFNISISLKREDISNIGTMSSQLWEGSNRDTKRCFSFGTAFSVNKELTADIEASLLEIKTLLDEDHFPRGN